jgi:hypothetical protein
VSDTGAPWNLPFPLPTDLVRDGADAIKDLAEATATGLSAAGGLVAVKHALFTGTQTNSTAAGANFAVSDLEISHSLTEAGNKLIISAYFGAAANNIGFANVGLAVMDGTTLIGVGASVGNRTAVGAGGWPNQPTSSNLLHTMPSVMFVYEPPDTTARTYTVRGINIDTTARTIYINRSDSDTDDGLRPRASSGFVIQEVKV